ncbi:unnamed protein product [Ixodes persulcatus]
MDTARGVRSRLPALPNSKGSMKKPKSVPKVRPSATRTVAQRAAHRRMEAIVRNVHNYFKHQRDVFVQDLKCTCPSCTRAKSAAEPVSQLPFAATEMATGVKKKMVYRTLKKSKGQVRNRTNSLARRCNADLLEGQQLRAILGSAFRQPELLYWSNVVRIASEDPHGIALEHLECMLETTGFVLQPWNNQLVPIEKRCLVEARARYLDEIETARKETTVVYIDVCWLRGRRLRRDPRPGGKSKIVVFAGTANVVSDVVFKLEVRPSVSEVEDAFISWVSQLSRDLSGKSTLVFVDIPWLATPAEQVPSEVTPKVAILRWLSERALTPDGHATRWELLELVKRHSGCVRESRLHTVVGGHGHRVLRIPQSASDLNPVTRIWPLLEGALASEELAALSETAVCEAALSSAANVWRELVSQLPALEESYRFFDASMARLLAELPPNTNPDRDDSLVLPGA